MNSPDPLALLAALRTLQVAPRPKRERLSAKGILPAAVVPIAGRLSELTERCARAVIPAVPELAADSDLAALWLEKSRGLARDYVRLSELAARKGLIADTACITQYSDAQLAAFAEAIVERFVGTHREIGFDKSRIEESPTKQQSADDIRALRAHYPLVDEWLIRRVVSSSTSDPAERLQEILNHTRDLAPDFQTIAPSDLVAVIATNRRNPRGALEVVTALQTSMAEEFGESLPSWLINRVCAHAPKRARTRLRAIRKSADDLRTLFPEEDASALLYAAASSPNPEARIHAFITDRAELEAAFPDVPRRIRESVALHRPADPIGAMRAILKDVQDLAEAYPDLPAATLLDTVANNRKDPARALGTIQRELDVLQAAFPEVPAWVRVKVAALRTSDPVEVMRNLLAVRDSFANAYPTVAPSSLLHLAAINPLRPEVHVRAFLERRNHLQQTFPDCTPKLIDDVACSFPIDPSGALGGILDARAAIRSARGDLPDWAVTQLARFHFQDVSSGLADFDARCAVLQAARRDATATQIFTEVLTRPVQTAEFAERFIDSPAFAELAPQEANRLMALMERARDAREIAASGTQLGDS